MSQKLPALRSALDFLPSPDRARPGVILRDPYRYTETMLLLPPAWVHGLRFLDGEHTVLDLQEHFTRMTGRLAMSADILEFVGLLRAQGFLDTEEFQRLKEQRESDFRTAPQREAIHAGTAYPGEAKQLSLAFDDYFRSASGAANGVPPRPVGLAAPHVSPEGGSNCYADAYAGLAAHPALAERTFVILGTSHYGRPETFGLTRKPFATPLGTLPVDTELVDWLEARAGGSVLVEDYCHSIEHSIEFQCVFLQHVLGPQLKILPILCGPFSESLIAGRAPESNERVARFFGALGEMSDRYGPRLFWVLGIDLAHIGQRYGDPFEALANRGVMVAVAEQDRRRIDFACAGDREGFFNLVKRNGDELKWCGYSPLYTFLAAVPSARGRLRRYEQWNIDPQSVVSFAALDFSL